MDSKSSNGPTYLVIMIHKGWNAVGNLQQPSAAEIITIPVSLNSSDTTHEQSSSR